MRRFRLKKKNFDKLEFEVFTGFNTKQLWVLESTTNTLIDPPKESLDKIKEMFRDDGKPYWDYEQMEAELLKEVMSNPDWLYEKNYWYNGNTEV